MKVLTFRADRGIDDRITDLSRKHGLSVGELVRIGLRAAYGIPRPGDALPVIRLLETVLENGHADSPPAYGAAVPRD